MKIDFANLDRQYTRYKREIDEAIARVVESTRFIMGPDVRALERELCEFTGSKHAIGCSSGTDALLLAMMAQGIGPGDEVITTPFTFIATAESVAFLGAKPIFVDIDETTYTIDVSKIEAAVTDRTRAIVPVSLYGQPADMDEIETIARKYGLKVIEDAAQSFGATYKEKRSCSLGDFGCTSFFPAKPLGCFGDGGAVFTDDDDLAEKIKSLRIHGQTERYRHEYIGMGGRLDTIQAAVLRVKLGHYPEDLQKRQEVARKYDALLGERGEWILPKVRSDRTSAWAQYSIRTKEREKLRKKLEANGIPTAVHYPIPLHLQACFGYLGYGKGDFPVAERVSEEIVSLPMNPDLRDEELEYIARKLKEFAEKT